MSSPLISRHPSKVNYQASGSATSVVHNRHWERVSEPNSTRGRKMGLRSRSRERMLGRLTPQSVA